MPPKILTGDQRGPRSKGWAITYNNGEEHTYGNNLDNLRALANHAKCEWACWQVEKASTTGQQHFQAAAWMKKREFRSTMKLFLPGAHLEPARGTPEENKVYCSKPETAEPGTFEEHGTMPAPTPGRRNDLEKVADHIMVNGIESATDKYPAVYIRYHCGMKALDAHYQPARIPAIREVYVAAYWGDSGAGKSYSAEHYDTPDNTYRLPISTSGLWFENYRGQRTLILEDFRGGQVFYAQLLQLLDGYKIQIPFKGGYHWAAWDSVIITSNLPPNEWYPDYDKHNCPQDIWSCPATAQNVVSPLERRIHYILHFGGQYPSVYYSPYPNKPKTRTEVKGAPPSVDSPAAAGSNTPDTPPPARATIEDLINVASPFFEGPPPDYDEVLAQQMGPPLQHEDFEDTDAEPTYSAASGSLPGSVSD